MIEHEFVADYDVEITTLRVGDTAIEIIGGKSETSTTMCRGRPWTIRPIADD
jgi:hypothetical protein